MTVQIVKQANGSIDLALQTDASAKPLHLTIERRQVGLFIKMLQLAEKAADFEFSLKL